MSDPVLVQSCLRCEVKKKWKSTEGGTIKRPKECTDCIQPIVHKNFIPMEDEYEMGVNPDE